ncbi:hypothetical protein Gotur_008169, partial [Gossypium turneri]
YRLLRTKFKPFTSTVHSVFHSTDGVTIKLLIKLQNGAFVEAVIMTYDTRLGKYGGKPRLGGPRSTLCISSQVGCKMGCKFCATGTMGFKNNLTSGEIVEQLVHASLLTNIRNIVFMWHHFDTISCHVVSENDDDDGIYVLMVMKLQWVGMGEPLNNYTALVEAIRVMTGSPFQLSPKRITVSTVGIIHAINKLHSDLPGLNLAVSLHAPVQEIRCQIMPSARAFPLEKLMTALQTYQKNSQQKIFIEYIMLDGMNDEEQQAHQLGKLLETFQVVSSYFSINADGFSVVSLLCTHMCTLVYLFVFSAWWWVVNKVSFSQGCRCRGGNKCGLWRLDRAFLVVNLIPFNPIGSSSQFRTSSDQKVSDFQKILRGTYNIRTTVRKQMGQDISGACGQLVVNLPDKRT